MKQSLQLKLGQQLTMTPQLQQAIRLLQLSTLELQTEIQQVLEENPMLETDEDTAPELAQEELLTSPQETKDKSNEHPPNISSENTVPEESRLDMENNQQIPDELAVDAKWEDSYDIANVTTSNNSSAVSSSDILENQSSETNTLATHLNWQLDNTQFSDIDKIIAIAIIDAINDDGYLIETLDKIYDGIKDELEIEFDEVEVVLHRIQHFDPLGVGAQNLSECLLVQLDSLHADYRDYDDVKNIIKNHLNLLGAHDYVRLQNKLQCNEAHLTSLVQFIQALNPKPGASISISRAHYIAPDIFVKKVNQQWRVSLNLEVTPKLRINSVYENHLSNSASNGHVSQLKTCLQEARWFINCLQTRNQTLLRVGEAIVKRQQLFLNYGEEGMKPMVLRDIAEELELHESTISRTTNNKYMHTPRGVFELKYFFSSHVNTVGGGACSATAIRHMVKKIINNENPKKPMSDNKISSLLVDEGINVARRTVAKYRESMLIPPSNERKRLA